MPGDRKTRTTGIHGIHGRWIPETLGGVRWRWKLLWCWLMHVEWFPKLKHISGTMMVAQVVACTNKLLVYERATALLGFFCHLWEPRKLSWATFWWNPTWLGNLLERPSIHRIIFEAPDESAAQKSSMIKTNISPLHLLRQYWDSLGSRFLWIHWNNGSIFQNILLGYSKKYCHWKHLWLNYPQVPAVTFLVRRSSQ